MSAIMILALLAIGQICALTLGLAITHLIVRITLAVRLYRDRGLDYGWSRAWRKAGYFTQH